jgi:ABC-type uncharacterized transport system auxiliary subunit
MRWRSTAFLFLALLTACSFGPQTVPPAQYDLGPLPTTAAAGTELQLLDVSAPGWLAGPAIHYRLDYRDRYRREAYRDSRWVAPPAALLAERLRQRSAAAGGAAAGRRLPLRLELEEFGQFFESPTQSEVRLRVRAWLGDAPATLKVFEISRAAAPDAAGAVQALAGASDQLIEQLLAWAAGRRP